MNKKHLSKLVWDGRRRIKHTSRRLLARNKRFIPEIEMNLNDTEKLKDLVDEGIKIGNERRKKHEEAEDRYYEELGNLIEQSPIGGRLRGRGTAIGEEDKE
jgi:hypothetical protein